MCTAGLGKDAYYDEGKVKDGKKLVTKLYNAGKFVIKQLGDFDEGRSTPISELEDMDKWIIYRLNAAAREMQTQFEKYEIGQALKVFENFFWRDFADNYLEMAKGRLYGQDRNKRLSAQLALYTTFLGVLKLAAPFVPHITEEMYHSSMDGEVLKSEETSGLFATNEGISSIHINDWPETEIRPDPDINKGAETALNVISEVRKYKTANQIRLGEPMGRVVIMADEDTLSILEGFAGDITSTSRASELLLVNKDFQDSLPTDLVITI